MYIYSSCIHSSAQLFQLFITSNEVLYAVQYEHIIGQSFWTINPQYLKKILETFM